jgi:uncharacterized membrane protein YdjX (TVP38/TMEM64 family)
MAQSRATQSGPWKWIAIGGGVVAVAVTWCFLPVSAWATALQTWLSGRGVWGGVLFAGLSILGTVLLVPGAPLSLVAGLVFGLGWGVLLVLVSATIGATLAFLVARYLVHDRTAAMATRSPTFTAVAQAISDEGWKVVALLRLSPLIPFNLQNSFYGITDIPLWHYVPATLVGILPGTLLYGYLGAAGTAALGNRGDSGGGGALRWSLCAAGLVATIIVTVVITRKAKATRNAFRPEADA